MKKGKKSLKIAAVVLGVLVVVYLGLSAYGAREAIEIPRLPLIYTGEALGLSYEDVSFSSRGDNVVLKGWYLPGQKSQAIIIIHGGFQNRIDDNVNTLGLAHSLVDTGYSVLLYDLRGRGESGGEARALSNIDSDIGGAVDYLQERHYGVHDIYIIGFCSGAASACIYASRNDIGALVLDGCFIDVKTMVARQARSIGIPEFFQNIFWPGGLLFTRWFYDFHVVNPIDIVPLVKCPVFFIHEENDEFITFDETLALFKASANPSNELWEVVSANHSQSFKTYPQDFITKVDRFFMENVNN